MRDGRKVGIAYAQGQEASMEDNYCSDEGKIKLRNNQSYPFSVFGVFDGNEGVAASKFMKYPNVSDHIKAYIERLCELDDLTDENIMKGLKECFRHLDINGPDATARTTATVAIILNNRLWVVNVLNSRTILVKKDGTAIQASEDATSDLIRYHKDEMLNGYKHIKVDGHFKLKSRAFGDKSLVDPQGKPLAPRPIITSYPLDFDYIVLTSKGLLQVATTNEIGQAIKEMYKQGDDQVMMARRLVCSALAKAAKANITVLVVKR